MAAAVPREDFDPRDQLRAKAGETAIDVCGYAAHRCFPGKASYALDLQALSKYPSADLTIERIGDLLEIDGRALLAASRNAA